MWSIALFMIFMLNAEPERIRVATYQNAWIEPVALEPADEFGRDHKLHLVEMLISEPEGYIVVYDAADPAYFCSRESKWVCVEGRRIRFAVPKRIGADRWEYRGAKYSIIGRSKIFLMGMSFDAYVIQSDIEYPRREVSGEIFEAVTLRWLYYYSETNGLIGFSLIEPTEQRNGIYYSADLCGYGGLVKYCQKSKQDKNGSGTTGR